MKEIGKGIYRSLKFLWIQYREKIYKVQLPQIPSFITFFIKINLIDGKIIAILAKC